MLFWGGCDGVDGRGVAHRVPPLSGALGRFLRVDGGRELLLRFPGVANSALSDAGLAAVMVCASPPSPGPSGRRIWRRTVPPRCMPRA